jgi:gluconokinase
MIVIVMGVSGSGKTTIGKLLAKDLGWKFYEGDEYHSRSNIEKMSHNIPLTDSDRKPWLAALRKLITDLLRQDQLAVITCSALKEKYRKQLQIDEQKIRWIHLKGTYSLISKRLRQRENHFMKQDLLRSQFEILEEPENAIVIDTHANPRKIVTEIKRLLRLSEH